MGAIAQSDSNDRQEPRALARTATRVPAVFTTGLNFDPSTVEKLAEAFGELAAQLYLEGKLDLD